MEHPPWFRLLSSLSQRIAEGGERGVFKSILFGLLNRGSEFQ
jgi:hypothetical protein